MSTLDPTLLSLLAYRLEAISIGHLALRHHMSWEEAPSMEVFFNGKQVIEGKATGFTNAAIESAIIHCRAILEFLGIKASKASANEIMERSARTNADDMGVEQFAGLSMLTKAKALAACDGEKSEAEAALALVFYAANKGLAHTTTSFKLHVGDAQLLEIAFLGIPKLLVNSFYVPLGVTPPTMNSHSAQESPNWVVKRTPTLALRSPFSLPVLLPSALSDSNAACPGR